MAQAGGPCPRTGEAGGRRAALGGVRGVLVAAGAVVVVVVVMLAVQVGGAPAGLGVSDPGLVVRVGTPLLRVMVDAAAMVCVGGVMFAVFLDPAPGLATVSPAGYAAMRWGGVAAGVWSVASVGLAVFTTADGTGQPVARVVSSPGVWSVMGALEEPVAQLVAGGLALVAAVGCRVALSWRGAVAVLGVAVSGLLPPAVTGHAASATGHDVSMDSGVVHVVAAAVWLGTLVAVVVALARAGGVGESVLRRYGVLAGACWVALAVSGLLEAVVLAPPSSWTSTPYGALVVAKVVVAAVLLGLGAAVLRRRLRRGARPPRARIAGFVAAELLFLVGALGVSVGMVFVVPLGFGQTSQTTTEALIGYNLAGPPTALRLLLDWRVDVIFVGVVVLLAGAYTGGVYRLLHRGDRWPWGRTVAWMLGCAALLLATCSGVERYADAMFSVHMIQHMALTALVPVLLCLGGPLALARSALRPVAPGAAPGPREWLTDVPQTRFLRAATHPLVVLGLFVGADYALYLTGLYSAWALYHWAHLAMNVFFLAVGYLFYWVAIGVDQSPWQLPYLARLGVLLAAMPFEAVFGIVLMDDRTAVGENFYRSLALPWVPDLLVDQRLAGAIAWAGATIPTLLAVLALVYQWSRAEDGPFDGGRTDDHSAAYRAMLRRLTETRR